MKAATIRDVARAADVSVATVSRALNSAATVSPEARDRVLKAAATLDYVPHSGARSLSRRRTDTIGVLLPDLHGPFFSELIRGIDSATRSRGLHLLLSHSHGDSQEAAAAIRAMRSRVDALLVMSPYADETALAAAAQGAIPLVLIGGSGDTAGHCLFAVDNEAGAAAMTRHLIAAGYQLIAFIAGPADNVEAAARRRGYQAALAEAGLAFGPVAQGDFTEASGVTAARSLLAGGPLDAIFAANDMMAVGALQALRDAGRLVPGDVALAGFDDIPIARFLDPPLTTVSVPIAELGRAAVECCVDLVAGGSGYSVTVAPLLVARGSTTKNNRQHSRASGEDTNHATIFIA